MSQLSARKRYGKEKTRLKVENAELKERIRTLQAALDAALATKPKKKVEA